MGSIFGADQLSIRDARIFLTARQCMHMSIVFTATGRVLRLHSQRTLHLEPTMTGTSGNDRDKQAVEQLAALQIFANTRTQNIQWKIS